MRKLFVCLALVAGVAAVGWVAQPAAVAQGKKDKDKDTKAKPGAPVIVITEGKDGKFRFVVRNAEGKLLAMSGPTGFATEKEAMSAIQELKEVIGRAKITHGKKTGKSGK